MGQLTQEFVYGVIFNFDKSQKLDKFIEKNPELFIKKDSTRNGYINYVMIWDGSKEGWDESDHADSLRRKFIKLLQELDASIYHIVDSDMDEQIRLFTHEDKYSKIKE